MAETTGTSQPKARSKSANPAARKKTPAANKTTAAATSATSKTAGKTQEKKTASTPTKAKAVRKRTAVTPISAEERQRLIAEAAYLRAELRNFVGGDPVQDWLEAEADVNASLKGPAH